VIRGFCRRRWARLPLTDADRTGGYWWDIAMRQVEVSRTTVFDAPRHARGFFEALCTDNLNIGTRKRCRSYSPAGFTPHHRAATEPGCCTVGMRSSQRPLRPILG
jgi:hypothetical protein